MRARQLLSGLAALAATLVAVVAVPWFLVATVGNPWPGRTAIDLRDQPAILTGALATVAWLLWGRFVVAMLVEFARQLSDRQAAGSRPAGGRIDVRPVAVGGGALVRPAGALVAAILALLPILTTAVPAVAHRPLPARRENPPVATPASPAPSPQTAETTPPAATVTVARGDTLFALARTHLGDPTRWREIFELNRDRPQSDGERLTSPSLIRPGWQLLLPAAPPSATGQRTHLVERGDSYWGIATDDLQETLDHEPTPPEILQYTQRLMSTNAPRLGHDNPALILPGEVVTLDGEAPALPVEPPAVTPAAPVVEAADSAPPDARTWPAPPDPAPTTSASTTTTTAPPIAVSPEGGTEDHSRWPHGLGAAVLLAAGTAGLVQSRRRAAMRAARKGARLRPPSEREVRTEQALAGASRVQTMARLDVAIRAAARSLASQQARLLAVTMAADGTVRLVPDRPCTPSDGPWRLDIESGAWVLSAAIDIAEIAGAARQVPFPSPALVALGVSRLGELFVDLEALGLLCIDAGIAGAELARHLATSLAVSPFAESINLITVGLGDNVHLEQPNGSSADHLEPALARAVAAASSTAAAVVLDDSTFAMRVGSDGETWDPAVVIAAGEDVDESLAEEIAGRTAGGGCGLAVVLDCVVPGAGAVLRRAGDRFVLDPLGIEVCVTGITVDDLAAVGELIAAAGEPAVDEPIPLVSASTHSREPYSEPEWALLVQTLGHVAVHTATGEPVAFERSKGLELVMWLSTHRDRPTRSRARTALWELEVRDATFANVVSDARRAMAKAIAPPEAEEWIGRRYTEQLPLHPLVVTDADLLESRLDAARGLPVHDAIDVLRPGLELVGGMPFADTAYLWVDAEGLGSSLTLLITSAATELAALFLQIGDIEGVFWATGQGLKVLPGHEELIALRMRAHAEHGDLAGVRNEWAAYERALSADLWATTSAEPSPKLVALRRRLLSPSTGERAS